MITLNTNYGPIVIELDFANTPVTAANFLKHAQDGYYDGTIFHRVIDNFMIQGGGFTVDMQPKEQHAAIENEADKGNSNTKGTVAMARTSDPHSASTQFFINVKDNQFLNHRDKTQDGWGYCVFGNVLSGMDTVAKIKQVKTTTKAGHDDVPVEDVVIESVVVDQEAVEQAHAK